MKYITHSADETIGLGERFAKRVGGGEVLCLYGELGAGKTTFIQGFAKGIGIRKRILSPTFIIVRRYSIIDSPLTFYHIDLYRIKQPEETIELGLKDWLHNPNFIVAIEWPERLGKLLPDKTIDIHFKYVNENKREISMNKIQIPND